MIVGNQEAFVLAGTVDVERPDDRRAHAELGAEVANGLFRQDLAMAVGIERLHRMVFADRQATRDSVDV